MSTSGSTSTASTSTAYLLVSHGSRDPRPGQAMERLASFVRSPDSSLWQPALRPAGRSETRANLQGRSTPRSTAAEPPSPLRRHRHRTAMPEAPVVGVACLETGVLSLAQQIVSFSHRARAAGASRVRVVPLFLLAGVHVTQDIPAEVEQAQALLSDLAIEVCPHLGSHPGLRGLLRAKLRATTAESFILLAHGSRRPGSTEAIIKLARSLGGTAAFWATAPDLESQVIHHMHSSVHQLAIVPYFLFTGTTTDAITHLTEDLAERFPQMGMHLLPPLGPTPDLARLVVDLALDRLPARAQQAPIPMARVAFRHTIPPSSMVS